MKTFKVTNGAVVFSGKTVQLISSAECLWQRLENKIRLYRNEWFLGPDEGIDWITILSKKSSNRIIYSEIDRILREDNEVNSITSIDMDNNEETRELSITFEVESIYGSVKGGSSI